MTTKTTVTTKEHEALKSAYESCTKFEHIGQLVSHVEGVLGELAFLFDAYGIACAISEERDGVYYIVKSYEEFNDLTAMF